MTMNYADEFINSAGEVAKMLNIINQITGKIMPVTIDVGGVKIALTAQIVPEMPPVMQEKVIDGNQPCGPDCECHKEEVAEEPVEEAPIQ